MRRLLLHMGMPKTGSTALQVWCVLNREWLRKQGVHYPEFRSDANARRGQSTGNGVALLRCLTADAEERPEAAVKVMRRVLRDLDRTDCNTVLYSNEWLFRRHRPELLRRFRDQLAEAGVALHAAVYVRDLAGHALSGYAQQVQTRLVSATFAEYVRSYDVPLQPILASMLDTLGPERLVVRHFDSHRHDLVRDFLAAALGVDADPPAEALTESRAVTNRSLTLRELEWKRYLNTRITTRSESRQLGAAMGALVPGEHDGRLAMTSADLEALRRFDDQVAWVNATFFGGRPVLAVQGDLDCAPDPVQPVQMTDEEHRLLDLLAVLATGSTS